MITTVERRYSLDEYRAIEEKAEGRNEYHNGEIVPILGITINHSRIGGNILAYLTYYLESVGVELPIAEIYRGVVFG